MIQMQPSSRLQQILLSSFDIITKAAWLFHFMPNSCSQSLLTRTRCSGCSVKRFDSQVCSNHEVLTQVYVRFNMFWLISLWYFLVYISPLCLQSEPVQVITARMFFFGMLFYIDLTSFSRAVAYGEEMLIQRESEG